MVLFDNMTHQASAKNSRAWPASSRRTASSSLSFHAIGMTERVGSSTALVP